MANSALIADLLKQFADNPRRVFARLANEYRKIGELDTAIEICREHVPHQPTYISGYIVLGQALFESGRLDESRSTFETALGLDPENLIALRQLGDIARANGDIEGARTWYHRLLEVDPQNDEIAEQLRAMEPAAPAPASDPVSWSDINPELAPHAAESAPAETPAPPLAGFEPTSFGFAAPEVPAPAAPAAPEPIDLDLGALEVPPAPPARAEPAPTVELASLDDLEFPSADAIEGRAAPEEAPAVPAAEPIPGPFGIELDLPASGAAPTAASAASAASAEPPLLELEPAFPSFDRVATADASVPPAVPPRDDAAPAFATETLAELYLRQGFTDRALDIYRRLATERPDDAALRERIARLERDGVPVVRDGAPAPRTMRAFFGAFASRRPPAPAAYDATAAEREQVSSAPAPASAAAPPDVAPAVGAPEPAPRPTPPEQGAVDAADGSGLAELFGAVPVDAADERAATALSAAFGDQPAPGATIGGQPARAASDLLSLDDVFQNGRQRGDQGAARPGTDVTFDEFFSRENGGASTEAQPPEPSPGAADADGGEKDLELFHAWLEGLKK
ncbi:MAG TPA: tetratricopeptide repeat protein [Gemmatimonadaceae bacterium]